MQCVVCDSCKKEQHITISSLPPVLHALQVTSTAGSPIFSNKTRYPYLFRAIPPETEIHRGQAVLVKHFKWDQVAIVVQNEHIFSEVRCSVTESNCLFMYVVCVCLCLCLSLCVWCVCVCARTLVCLCVLINLRVLRGFVVAEQLQV